MALINVITPRNKTRKERTKGPKTSLMVATKEDDECKLLQSHTHTHKITTKKAINSSAPCNNNEY
jgi:hypothetical protein